MHLTVNKGYTHIFLHYTCTKYLEFGVWQASLEKSIAQAFEVAVRVHFVAQRIEQHEAQSVVRAQGGVLDQRLDALYTSNTSTVSNKCAANCFVKLI